MEKIRINKGSRHLSVDVKRTGFFSRAFGLMFRTRNTENLLFEFRSKETHAFTSVFVFFPFLMIWLDEKNGVLGSEIVRPFELSIVPKFSFKKVVEIPINAKNKRILGFFVGKQGKV